MESKLKITYYQPDKAGVYSAEKGYFFATETESDNEIGVLLYDKNGREVKIPFSDKGKCGILYGVLLESDEKEFPFETYNFYEGETVFTDPYAKLVNGLNIWGNFEKEKRKTYGVLTRSEYDWEGDKPLELPVEDTIIYGLNVRAFTMDKSAKVRKKGTFEGVCEKIPHLKKLGITAVELMPAYEYDECMEDKTDKLKNRVNCWGFQEAYYFAPKASYSMERPDISFKNMVKELHKNQIEVLMHFYFPPTAKASYIMDVLRYWVREYHIDGIRLSGFKIPFIQIAEDAILKRTKIRSTYFPLEDIYGNKIPLYKNLLSDNGNFRNDMRRFLKGDENLINQVIHYQKNNSDFCVYVNYMADYDGFTLYDMVSYEQKHNEANHEDNHDGTDLNYSWNCGTEGESRKKAVLELRKKQIKNALSFLFLSQGIPYLFSGDEFGNTRFGNNNAYCQDNEIGYLKWSSGRFATDLFAFACELIALRKKYKILHQKQELKGINTTSCGYPDISYHGTEAWRPDVSYISRMTGIMLCQNDEREQTQALYLAYNMHWEAHRLALPKLPKGQKWQRIFSTSGQIEEERTMPEHLILAEGRSVCLYSAVPDESFLKEKKTATQKKKAPSVKENGDRNKHESMETF